MIFWKRYLNRGIFSLEIKNLFDKVKIRSRFESYVKHLKNAVFEITEQFAIDNIDKLENFVAEKNIKMALDDFGSEYSSIKAVVELTTGKVIKYLKIDGSLIKDMEKSEENFYIVESMVKIAKTLNLKTGAEFIENKNVLETVKSLGIDYTQGFYLGKPKPLSNTSLVEHFHNREYFIKQLKIDSDGEKIQEITDTD
ncbi:MAG: EAL domain-containing protein [Persephonella sp.]|nr:EAL domain-containing protein [Persephonella sp.]